MLLRGAEVMSLRDKVAVTGIGETLYQRGSTRSSTELQLRAWLTAIADAGLTPREIDGIIPIGITGASAEEIATNLGLEELRYSALTPMGGASSIAAIQTAAAAISTGLCNHVLIAAGRNVSGGAKAGARIHTMPQFHLITEFELPLGAVAPAQLYAPMARRHMELFGTTSEQMGEVAVAARAHALLNDNAIMKQPITLEDHQASRMIADPFRLLDCSLESQAGRCSHGKGAQGGAGGVGHPHLLHASPNTLERQKLAGVVGKRKQKAHLDVGGHGVIHTAQILIRTHVLQHCLGGRAKLRVRVHLPGGAR